MSVYDFLEYKIKNRLWVWIQKNIPTTFVCGFFYIIVLMCVIPDLFKYISTDSIVSLWMVIIKYIQSVGATFFQTVILGILTIFIPLFMEVFKGEGRTNIERLVFRSSFNLPLFFTSTVLALVMSLGMSDEDGLTNSYYSIIYITIFISFIVYSYINVSFFYRVFSIGVEDAALSKYLNKLNNLPNAIEEIKFFWNEFLGAENYTKDVHNFKSEIYPSLLRNIEYIARSRRPEQIYYLRHLYINHLHKNRVFAESSIQEWEKNADEDQVFFHKSNNVLKTYDDLYIKLVDLYIELGKEIDKENKNIYIQHGRSQIGDFIIALYKYALKYNRSNIAGWMENTIKEKFKDDINDNKIILRELFQTWLTASWKSGIEFNENAPASWMLAIDSRKEGDVTLLEDLKVAFIFDNDMWTDAFVDDVKTVSQDERLKRGYIIQALFGKVDSDYFINWLEFMMYNYARDPSAIKKLNESSGLDVRIPSGFSSEQNESIEDTVRKHLKKMRDNSISTIINFWNPSPAYIKSIADEIQKINVKSNKLKILYATLELLCNKFKEDEKKQNCAKLAPLMTKINLNTLTIKKAHDAMKAGEYTVRELVDAYLSEIKEKNDDINAYLHLFTDIDARVEIAQKMFTDGTSTELTGIPMGLKAILMKKGQVCNASSKMLENYKATYSATAVERLEEQGVIFLGSTNTDEFAMGASTENSAFGVTKNPVDTTRVAGGSSGGSIAAVAGNMCLAALGTDTGGSIREPASFCGVVGMRPTYGAVSRYGSMPMGSSFDQISPTAKHASDCELVLKAMRGDDEYDMTALAKDTWVKDVTKEKYKIAIPKSLVDGSSEEVKEAFGAFVSELKAAGHTVEELEIPILDIVLAVYYILVPAEVSSNTARYDGLRYGTKVDGKDLQETYIKTRGEGFGDEVKRRIMLGTYVLSAGYADKYYEKALALREQLKAELAKIFTEYDFILTPTAPVVAPKIGSMEGDPLTEYLMDIFTVTANTAGTCAISVPSKETKDGLPVGMQFMAAPEHDDALLDIAKKLEK